MSSAIGIRELKANLSSVLKRVQQGAHVSVTDRGREIARLVPSSEPRKLAWAHAMVAKGEANWGGGKPAGLAKPIRLTPGRSASDLILEDRR
jgi:hypothetical protein